MIKQKNHELLKSWRFPMNYFVVLTSADLMFISIYFKSNFKLIKKVCQENVSIFRDKKKQSLLQYFLSLVE